MTERKIESFEKFNPEAHEWLSKIQQKHSVKSHFLGNVLKKLCSSFIWKGTSIRICASFCALINFRCKHDVMSYALESLQTNLHGQRG